MGKFSRLGNSLYEGDVSIDFMGRKWLWYSISGVILIAALGGLLFRGLNLGIEFEGGSQYAISLPSSQITQDNVAKVRTAVENSGIKAASTATAITAGKTIQVTTEDLTNADSNKIVSVLAKTMDVSEQKVSIQQVGASWGRDVATRAIEGLIIFLILVVLFIAGYFREWKMALAAFVALLHDLAITIGIYALSGFQVTPATVTGVLTILGFSLYDTVVVFDKVRENTKDLRSSRRTYSELANLAVNQTLVRSINTSFVALLPVAALLYVGIFSLGDGDLKDLALALFVGMGAGTYSSIFIATPLLAQLKTREKQVSEQDRRAKARQRRDADRYANVPSFTEDMPIGAEPGAVPEDEAPVRERAAFQVPTATVRPAPAAGTGRTVPDPKAPVEQSGSAHRPQPSRQPRSKRGK
ncbi:MAG TPA: protein translocase subunit SecF [Marmoricola sp.]|jgi:preprotein translocase subunit SecF|nr:protein translocase subunit SecF [Marmoricola sp.]